MYGSWGFRGVKRTAAGLGALALVAVLFLALAGPASAGKLIGKDGRVYACYKTKGKAKGSIRLVAKHGKCHKREKKISWLAKGQAAAEQGAAGENGLNGEDGVGGEPGVGGSAAAMEQRIQALSTKVLSLESILKGVTNSGLLGALSKLQGVSGPQLQEAVKKIADVNALCTQATKLTSQANALGAVFGGLNVNNALAILGGALNVPTVPASLPTFGCP